MSVKLLDFLNQAAKVNIQYQQRGLGQPVLLAVMDFKREAALASADYKTVLSEADSFPLGAQPILISNLILDSSVAAPVLSFHLTTGQSLNLSIDHDMGLAIGKLLSDVLRGTGWVIETGQEFVGNGAEALGAMRVH